MASPLFKFIESPLIPLAKGDVFVFNSGLIQQICKSDGFELPLVPGPVEVTITGAPGTFMTPKWGGIINELRDRGYAVEVVTCENEENNEGRD